MNFTGSQVQNLIETQYLEWTKSSQKKKRCECRIEGVDLVMIFNSKYLLNDCKCRTPSVIHATVNISSNDNSKIEEIFKKHLITINDLYLFSAHYYDFFNLRFFENEQFIEEKLVEEKAQYEPKVFSLYNSQTSIKEQRCCNIL